MSFPEVKILADYKEMKKQKHRRRKRRAAATVALSALIVVQCAGLVYISGRMIGGKPLFDAVRTPAAAPAASSEVPSDTGGQQAENTGKGTYDSSLWNTLTPVARTLSYDTTTDDTRMYALPENGRVSLDYFSGALFIGDSLTQGFGIYEPLKSIATVCAYIGVTPSQILDNAAGYRQDMRRGVDTPVPMLDDILSHTAPTSIYIGMGTNALNSAQDDDAIIYYYGQLLDVLRTAYPNIPIYVQGITPVTAEKAASDARFSNDRIRSLNDSLARMAVEKGMYYINTHEVLADDYGNLREDLAGSDGYHLRSAVEYQVWVDYLCTHTVYNPMYLQYWSATT